MDSRLREVKSKDEKVLLRAAEEGNAGTLINLLWKGVHPTVHDVGDSRRREERIVCGSVKKYVRRRRKKRMSLAHFSSILLSFILRLFPGCMYFSLCLVFRFVDDFPSKFVQI